MGQLPLHCRKIENPAGVDFSAVDPRAWFGPHAAALSDQDAERAFVGVQRHLRERFPHAEMHRTPVLTGASCLESCLPWPGAGKPPYDYPALPPEIQAILHAETAPQRHDVYTLPRQRSRTLCLYDRRVAYLSL